MTNPKAAIRQWQDQTALDRYKLIAPLMDPAMDPALRRQKRIEIALSNNLSPRTLYRYEKSFNELAFEGLRPQDRTKRRSQKLPENFDELLAEAMQLKREVPERSVNTIITILELEGRVSPGVLKRSTMERHLYKKGFGKRHLQMYVDARNSSSKRFCKPNRMMLVQADIKYGPVLPIGKNGCKKQTYLSSIIDDHSRFLLWSRFYDNQEAPVVEHTFKQAILNYGKFDAAYIDNGKQYVSRQLGDAMARLGIDLKRARPRSGKSKGKIEKFHQVVDAFLAEARLQKIRSLEELNDYWEAYLNEYYHVRPHEGIHEYYESLGAAVPETGISPKVEWNRDSRPLTFIDTAVVTEAFRYHEKRLVDRGACISFRGSRYETRPELIGCEVEISYDPMAPETIMVYFEGITPFEAKPVNIGSFCDKNPTLPISMQQAEASSSRMLDAVSKKHAATLEKQADALSFASYGKEDR